MNIDFGACVTITGSLGQRRHDHFETERADQRLPDSSPIWYRGGGTGGGALADST